MQRILSILILISYVQLWGQSTITVLRGPYLQSLHGHGVTICWRTNIPCGSTVTLNSGTSSLTFSDSLRTTEHRIPIAGLLPGTKWSYCIGSPDTVLAGYSDDRYFFTAPATGQSGRYRFWIIGDAGTNTLVQDSVRDAYIAYAGNEYTNGWIMLGDNAYNSGTDAEYQDAVFQNAYEQLLQQSCLWPAPGNHDYYCGADATTQTGPYYDIFNLPGFGECGGIASGTEAYYSWDYGNVHFISLDSYDSGRDSTNAMGLWLKADLAANTLPWVIAYWHHPPYTKGSHDSDNPGLIWDPELPEVREQWLPILERFGVDLVLCGHSHSYERSMLIHDHYGYSPSFSTVNIADSSAGNWDSGCPYQNSGEGTIYAVVGCSGKVGSTSSGWPHPAMYHSTASEPGSMVLEVEGNRLDAIFLNARQEITDRFTLLKKVPGKDTVTVCAGDTVTLHAGWKGSHVWHPGGFRIDSLTIIPYGTTWFTVSDSMGCVSDSILVKVIAPCSVGLEDSLLYNPPIWPNPVHSGQMVCIANYNISRWQLTSTTGIERTAPLLADEQGKIWLDTTGLPSGCYFLQTGDENGITRVRMLLVK